MINDDEPSKPESSNKPSNDASRKREDRLAQQQNSRKFKKDSIIFGIPVKNNSKTINATLDKSTAMS